MERLLDNRSGKGIEPKTFLSVNRINDTLIFEFEAYDSSLNGFSNIDNDELNVEMWDAIFESDLRGTFYAIKSVLPYMLKNENGGSIVNIGSMASINGDISSTAYACAKAGVDMLTKSVALQYGKKGIRCNCVRPGLIVTPENDANVPPFVKDIFLSNIMVNRYGCPEDIGHLCVYLASDESAYVTGQVMTVDGGLNSHVPTVAQFKSLNKRTW